MYPQNPDQATEQHPIHNPLSVMQPGEHVVCEIERHPIGMLGIYAVAGLLLIVLAVLAFIVAPNTISSGSRAEVMATTGLGFIIFTALALGFVFISNKIYWGNSWVVTSDSITQITQTSFFDKRSSQLSLGNLEDVTAEQNGMLAHLLNYGLIRAETAGERSKFMFPYCPNPNYYAQLILSARELFEQSRHSEVNMQRPYRAEDAYQQASAQLGQTPIPQPPDYPSQTPSSYPVSYPDLEAHLGQNYPYNNPNPNLDSNSE